MIHSATRYDATLIFIASSKSDA